MGTRKNGESGTSACGDTPDPAELTALVAGNTAFAAALYAGATAADNVVLAPASVSLALAMTHTGARGETAAEMARSLRFPPLDSDQLQAAFATLAASFDNTPGVELAIASALFGQKDYGFLPAFLALLAEHHGAGLREVDFGAGTERARETINEWVEKQTKGKIKDLLAPGILDDLTRLVLVNAVYFKGSWASVFPKKSTTEQPFFKLDGASSPVPLMHQKGDYKLVAIDGGHMLELPYDGDAISMVVLLPEKNDGLADIEAKLAANLGAWLERFDGARPRKVDVYLPRFRVDAAFRLDAALQSLGMNQAFDANLADFSGMNGLRDLYIAAVVHKAFVDVNEEGTTAAAATAVVMATRSLPPKAPVFRADHPFVFLIRDTRTNSVLFLGRLVAPR